jgi:hypothetical protein
MSFMVTRDPSTAREISGGLTVSNDTVISVLKLFMANGLASKTDKQNRAWKYKLTKGAAASLDEMFKPHSSNNKKGGPAPFVPRTYSKPATNAPRYTPYVAPPWESTRPGADDHKMYKTKGF